MPMKGMLGRQLALLGIWRRFNAEASNQAGGHRPASGGRNHRTGPGSRGPPARHGSGAPHLPPGKSSWLFLEPPVELDDLPPPAGAQVVRMSHARAHSDPAAVHLLPWRIWSALARLGLPGLGPRLGFFQPGALPALIC